MAKKGIMPEESRKERKKTAERLFIAARESAEREKKLREAGVEEYTPSPVRAFELAAEHYRALGMLKEAGKSYGLAFDEASKRKDTIPEVGDPRYLRNLETYSERMGKYAKGSWRIGRGKLEALVMAVVGLVSGIFFLSPNITGNAIANLSDNTSSWIGAALIFVGLVAGFFWIKNRKK